MKNIQFAIAIIVVGLLGMRYTIVAREHDHKQHQMKTTQSKEQTKEVYTCPMHPEVTSDKAGKCPKCGMALKKKAMSKGETKSEKKTEMYACPMHPDEKSDKTGNCSKCGMKLEKIKK
ncbi:MAG: hypothetical protein HZB59_09975 [Ignavibacteriales bacterium]|nr:hypothetical protein [Ignavibacteriales bacterium]